MNQKKILAIDDDPDILESLRLILRFEGYDVEVLSRGSDVFAVADYPDLFLLDVWSSGEDGRDICRQLKRNPETKDIPVIMISASSALRGSTLEAGASRFIPKPFDMGTLLSAIDDLINK